MIEKFRELCGDLGGYESDFLYICSFITAFDAPLKSPTWSFVGLRTAFNMPSHDHVLRDIMRRCFVLAGRNIIGGIDDSQDSRMDRAITRLLADREFDASILFPYDTIPDLTNGFLSLSTDTRVRLVRFIMQSVFSAPHVILSGVTNPSIALVGIDAGGHRYYLLKDSTLEVGCWREVANSGAVELIATSTDIMSSMAASLKADLVHPERSKGMCTYCRKKISEEVVTCHGCEYGSCHYKCLPSAELNGIPWSCSSACRQSYLANTIQMFVDEIEPQQKAAMRKRRRLAGEIHSLQIHSNDFKTDNSRRSTRGGRATGAVDYSFRDYDKFISHAIKRSERRADYASSEEETYIEPVAKVMSREERMALREKKFESVPKKEDARMEPDEQVKDERAQESTESAEATYGYADHIEYEPRYSDEPHVLAEYGDRGASTAVGRESAEPTEDSAYDPESGPSDHPITNRQSSTHDIPNSINPGDPLHR